MPCTEDLTPFFNASEFADAVTIGGASVNGIFDNAHTTQNLATGYSTTQPALTLPTSHVPADTLWPATAVTVEGANYSIADHEPDGTGVSVLLLRKA